MSVLEKSHISGNPFGDLVDAHTFFYSFSHKKALHRLERGLESGCGMLLLTGEIGSGKTTIWRHLRETKEEHFIFAESGNPFLRPSELLFRFCSQFGISTEGVNSVQSMTDRIELFCKEQRKNGKKPVIVVDECHLLKKNHFSLILVLSNLRFDGEPLLQILLVGQIEVMDLLKTTGLEAVNQRIGVRCELSSMNEKDTARYVQHKLSTSKFPFALSFDDAAFAMIWRVTGGLPRLVNHLCANVVDDADYSGNPRVRVRDVEAVAASPLYQGLYTIRTKKDSTSFRPVALSLIGLASLLVLYLFFSRGYIQLFLGNLVADEHRDSVSQPAIEVDKPEVGINALPTKIPSVGNASEQAAKENKRAEKKDDRELERLRTRQLKSLAVGNELKTGSVAQENIVGANATLFTEDEIVSSLIDSVNGVGPANGTVVGEENLTSNIVLQESSPRSDNASGPISLAEKEAGHLMEQPDTNASRIALDVGGSNDTGFTGNSSRVPKSTDANNSVGLSADAVSIPSSAMANGSRVEAKVAGATVPAFVKADNASTMQNNEKEEQIRRLIIDRAADLRISALVSAGNGTEKSSMALINNEIVRPEGVINGLVVQKINPDSILFRMHGVVYEKKMNGAQNEQTE
jgi:type II secretory pathway predicted ATPase ExeA